MEPAFRHLSINIFALRLLILMIITPSSHSEWGLNMTESVTAIGRDIHGLHMTIFYICVAIAIVVFGIMLYSIIRHRKSLGAEAKPFHESTIVEIIWTTIPLLILVAMAIPATKTLIDMYDTETSDIDIKITGYQWKWRYEYLNTDIDFFSTLTTTQDQMHGLEAKSKNYLLEVDKHLVILSTKKSDFYLPPKTLFIHGGCPNSRLKKMPFPALLMNLGRR